MKIKIIIFLSILVLGKILAQDNIMVPYKEGNKYGFMDTLGHIILQPKYQEVQDMKFYYDTIANKASALYTVKQDGIIKVIDQNDKVFFLPSEKYDSVFSVHLLKDRFITQKDKNYGFILRNKVIIPCIYEDILPHYNNSCLVKKNGLTGMIDQEGTIKIPLQYQDIEFAGFTDTSVLWLAKGMVADEYYEDKRTEFIDYGEGTKYSNYPEDAEIVSEVRSGDNAAIEKLENTYDRVKNIYQLDSWYYVERNNKWGLYDLNTEKEIIAPKYDDLDFLYNIYPDNEILFRVSLNDKQGIINQNDKVYVPLSMDRVSDVYNNMCGISKDEKYGVFILNTVYPYIEPKYDKLIPDNYILVNRHWSFLLFLVEHNGKEYYVGENGVEYTTD
jgi:hypothetical protein